MANFLDLKLECNGQALLFGKSAEGEPREFGITKITGLESSALDINTSDNALVDGLIVDGKRILKRVIHIEAELRDDRNNETERQRIIHFFNPKFTGRLTANLGGTERNIDYELEGWTFPSNKIRNKIAISVDLICPSPYMRNMNNYGRNMASYTALAAFPWRVLNKKVKGTPDPHKGLTLRGTTTGYRTLAKNVLLMNDGDVPCGLVIRFVASRGAVKNPKITQSVTGDYVRVICDLKKGDELVVDTDSRHQIIEINGVNAYQKIDRQSKPFMLAVGENQVSYNADENYSNLDVMLYYTPLYLGV